MDQTLLEKTISQSYAFEGRILKTRVDQAQLPNGNLVSREVIEHPGGVAIAALTEKRELLFVQQFRYPYGKVVLELPAGKLEKGEDPLEAGKRELKEETGAVGKDYRFLGEVYPSPGFCDEILYLYACQVDTLGENNPDEDEFLEVERIPLKKAVEMVLSNEIPDAKTQICILKTALLWGNQK